MRLAHSQRGISIWLVLLILVCLAVSGIVGLKLFPVYLENTKIERGVVALMNEPLLTAMSKRELKDALLRRLDIDSVTEINHHNFWEVVRMEKEGDIITLRVAYEVIVPMMANVSALVEFDKTFTNPAGN